MSSTREMRSTQQNVTRSSSKGSYIARSTVELHAKKNDISPIRKRQYKRPRVMDKDGSSSQLSEDSPSQMNTSEMTLTLHETSANYAVYDSELPTASSNEVVIVSNESGSSEGFSETIVTDCVQQSEDLVGANSSKEYQPESINADIPMRTRGRSSTSASSDKRKGKGRIRELDNLSFSNPGRALSLPQIKKNIGRPKKEAKDLRLHSKVNYFQKQSRSLLLSSLKMPKPTNLERQSISPASMLRAWKEKKGGVKRKLGLASTEDSQIKKKKKVLVNSVEAGTSISEKVQFYADSSKILTSVKSHPTKSSLKRTSLAAAMSTPALKKGPGRPKKVDSFKKEKDSDPMFSIKQKLATSTCMASSTPDQLNIVNVQTCDETTEKATTAVGSTQTETFVKKKRRKRRTLGCLDKQKKPTKAKKLQRSKTCGSVLLTASKAVIIQNDPDDYNNQTSTSTIQHHPCHFTLTGTEREHSYSKPMPHWVEQPIEEDCVVQISEDREIVFKTPVMDAICCNAGDSSQTSMGATSSGTTSSKPSLSKKPLKSQAKSESRNDRHLEKLGHKAVKGSLPKQLDRNKDNLLAGAGDSADQIPDSPMSTVPVKRPRGRPKFKATPIWPPVSNSNLLKIEDEKKKCSGERKGTKKPSSMQRLPKDASKYSLDSNKKDSTSEHFPESKTEELSAEKSPDDLCLESTEQEKLIPVALEENLPVKVKKPRGRPKSLSKTSPARINTSKEEPKASHSSDQQYEANLGRTIISRVNVTQVSAQSVYVFTDTESEENLDIKSLRGISLGSVPVSRTERFSNTDVPIVIENIAPVPVKKPRGRPKVSPTRVPRNVAEKSRDWKVEKTNDQTDMAWTIDIQDTNTVKAVAANVDEPVSVFKTDLNLVGEETVSASIKKQRGRPKSLSKVSPVRVDMHSKSLQERTVTLSSDDAIDPPGSIDVPNTVETETRDQYVQPTNSFDADQKSSFSAEKNVPELVKRPRGRPKSLSKASPVRAPENVENPKIGKRTDTSSACSENRTIILQTKEGPDSTSSVLTNITGTEKVFDEMISGSIYENELALVKKPRRRPKSMSKILSTTAQARKNTKGKYSASGGKPPDSVTSANSNMATEGGPLRDKKSRGRPKSKKRIVDINVSIDMDISDQLSYFDADQLPTLSPEPEERNPLLASEELQQPPTLERMKKPRGRPKSGPKVSNAKLQDEWNEYISPPVVSNVEELHDPPALPSTKFSDSTKEGAQQDAPFPTIEPVKRPRGRPKYVVKSPPVQLQQSTSSSEPTAAHIADPTTNTSAECPIFDFDEFTPVDSQERLTFSPGLITMNTLPEGKTMKLGGESKSGAYVLAANVPVVNTDIGNVEASKPEKTNMDTKQGQNDFVMDTQDSTEVNDVETVEQITSSDVSQLEANEELLKTIPGKRPRGRPKSGPKAKDSADICGQDEMSIAPVHEAVESTVDEMPKTATTEITAGANVSDPCSGKDASSMKRPRGRPKKKTQDTKSNSENLDNEKTCTIAVEIPGEASEARQDKISEENIEQLPEDTRVVKINIPDPVQEEFSPGQSETVVHDKAQCSGTIEIVEQSKDMEEAEDIGVHLDDPASVFSGNDNPDLRATSEVVDSLKIVPEESTVRKSETTAVKLGDFVFSSDCQNNFDQQNTKPDVEVPYPDQTAETECCHSSLGKSDSEEIDDQYTCMENYDSLRDGTSVDSGSNSAINTDENEILLHQMSEVDETCYDDGILEKRLQMEIVESITESEPMLQKSSKVGKPGEEDQVDSHLEGLDISVNNDASIEQTDSDLIERITHYKPKDTEDVDVTSLSETDEETSKMCRISPTIHSIEGYGQPPLSEILPSTLIDGSVSAEDAVSSGLMEGHVETLSDSVSNVPPPTQQVASDVRSTEINLNRDASAVGYKRPRGRPPKKKKTSKSSPQQSKMPSIPLVPKIQISVNKDNSSNIPGSETKTPTTDVNTPVAIDMKRQFGLRPQLSRSPLENIALRFGTVDDVFNVKKKRAKAVKSMSRGTTVVHRVSTKKISEIIQQETMDSMVDVIAENAPYDTVDEEVEDTCAVDVELPEEEHCDQPSLAELEEVCKPCFVVLTDFVKQLDLSAIDPADEFSGESDSEPLDEEAEEKAASHDIDNIGEHSFAGTFLQFLTSQDTAIPGGSTAGQLTFQLSNVMRTVDGQALSPRILQMFANYKCKHCDFLTQSNLVIEEHVLHHLGGLPLECGWCQQRFSNTSGFNTHHGRIHPAHKRDCRRAFNYDERDNYQIVLRDGCAIDVKTTDIIEPSTALVSHPISEHTEEMKSEELTKPITSQTEATECDLSECPALGKESTLIPTETAKYDVQCGHVSQWNPDQIEPLLGLTEKTSSDLIDPLKNLQTVTKDRNVEVPEKSDVQPSKAGKNELRNSRQKSPQLNSDSLRVVEGLLHKYKDFIETPTSPADSGSPDDLQSATVGSCRIVDDSLMKEKDVTMANSAASVYVEVFSIMEDLLQEVENSFSASENGESTNANVNDKDCDGALHVNDSNTADEDTTTRTTASDVLQPLSITEKCDFTSSFTPLGSSKPLDDRSNSKVGLFCSTSPSVNSVDENNLNLEDNQSIGTDVSTAEERGDKRKELTSSVPGNALLEKLRKIVRSVPQTGKDSLNKPSPSTSTSSPCNPRSVLVHTEQGGKTESSLINTSSSQAPVIISVVVSGNVGTVQTSTLHSQRDGVGQNRKLQDNRFTCTHCMFGTDDRRRMVEHITARHADDALFACSICDNAFSPSMDTIRQHIGKVHVGQDIHKMCKRLPHFYDLEELREHESLKTKGADNIFEMFSTGCATASQSGDHAMIEHYRRARDVMHLRDKAKQQAEADSTTSGTGDMEMSEQESTLAEEHSVGEDAEESSSSTTNEKIRFSAISSPVSAEGPTEGKSSTPDVDDSTSNTEMEPTTTKKDLDSVVVEDSNKVSSSGELAEAPAAIELVLENRSDGDPLITPAFDLEPTEDSVMEETADAQSPSDMVTDVTGNEIEVNQQEEDCGLKIVNVISLSGGEVGVAKSGANRLYGSIAISKEDAESAASALLKPTRELPSRSKCKHCGLQLPSMNKLLFHLHNFHQENYCFTCPYCELKMGKLEEAVREHIRQDHKDSDISVPLNFVPETNDSPKLPVSSAGVSGLGASKKMTVCAPNIVDGKSTGHKCSRCSKEHSGIGLLLKHLETIHKEDCLLVCPYCKKGVSKEEAEVYYHIKLEHQDRDAFVPLLLISNKSVHFEGIEHEHPPVKTAGASNKWIPSLNIQMLEDIVPHSSRTEKAEITLIVSETHKAGQGIAKSSVGETVEGNFGMTQGQIDKLSHELLMDCESVDDGLFLQNSSCVVEEPFIPISSLSEPTIIQASIPSPMSNPLDMLKKATATILNKQSMAELPGSPQTPIADIGEVFNVQPRPQSAQYPVPIQPKTVIPTPTPSNTVLLMTNPLFLSPAKARKSIPSTFSVPVSIAPKPSHVAAEDSGQISQEIQNDNRTLPAKPHYTSGQNSPAPHFVHDIQQSAQRLAMLNSPVRHGTAIRPQPQKSPFRFQQRSAVSSPITPATTIATTMTRPLLRVPSVIPSQAGRSRNTRSVASSDRPVASLQSRNMASPSPNMAGRIYQSPRSTPSPALSFDTDDPSFIQKQPKRKDEPLDLSMSTSSRERSASPEIDPDAFKVFNLAPSPQTETPLNLSVKPTNPFEQPTHGKPHTTGYHAGLIHQGQSPIPAVRSPVPQGVQRIPVPQGVQRIPVPQGVQRIPVPQGVQRIPQGLQQIPLGVQQIPQGVQRYQAMNIMNRFRHPKPKQMSVSDLLAAKARATGSGTGQFVKTHAELIPGLRHTYVQRPYGAQMLATAEVHRPETSTPDNTNSPNRAFTCPKCNFVTTNSAAMKAHVTNVHKVKYRCPYCPHLVPLTQMDVPYHIGQHHPGKKIMFYNL